MNPLALLLITSAVLVWGGQWISLRAQAAVADLPLPPRLRARLRWWAGHRTLVGTGCLTVAVVGVVGGTFAG